MAATAAERDARRQAKKEAKATAQRDRAEKREDDKRRRRQFVTYYPLHGEKCTVDITRNATAHYYKTGRIGPAEVDAAQRFDRDMQTAGYTGLRSGSLEPGVDGGKLASGHLAAVDAQRRLRALQSAVGEEAFALLQAMICGVLGKRITTEYIHAQGGPEHRQIGAEFCAALHAAAVHYGLTERRPSSTMKALQQIWSEMCSKVGELA